MARRYIITCLAIGAACCPGPGEASSPPSVDRVIREMELVREKIDDLFTVVERSQKDDAGRETKAEIRLSYQKPDRLRSEVRGDRERVTVINGSRMLVYSPGLDVVEKYDLKDEERQKRAVFEMSWGLTSPIKSLVRGMNRSSSVLEDGSLLVELVPDQKDARIKKIEVRVDPSTWLVTRMDIFPAGQPPVLLTVREWRVNAGFPDGYFDFQVPEGADVFEPLEGWGGQGF